jgi:hypothetical protein
MESHITIEYVAPGGAPQDAEEIASFTDSEGTMKIPTENQIVTLPVESPGGLQEQQKDFRVVQVRYAFSGFVPKASHQFVHIFVTDLDE